MVIMTTMGKAEKIPKRNVKQIRFFLETLNKFCSLKMSQKVRFSICNFVSKKSFSDDYFDFNLRVGEWIY